MRVVCYPYPALQTVGLAVGVRYGSVDENPMINGSAHFLEHMMFKGTERRTWRQINEEVKSIGAYQNAFTSWEMTMYLIQSYKGKFERAIDITSDMIKGSTIPPKEMELERGPIINENLMSIDNPQNLFQDYMPRALFKKHPVKMPIGGDNKKTIKKITRDHLFEIYEKNYAPENMVVSISGGITEERALGLAERYFGDFERDYRKKARSIAREEQKRTTMKVKKKGIKQARIGVGFKCGEFRPDNIDEYLNMLVVNELLRYRLYEEVREKRGLSYDPYCTYNSYQSFGFIAADCGTEPAKVGAAKKVMVGEFKKVQDGEISAKEISNMKEFLRIQYTTRREQTMDYSIAMAMAGLIGGDPTVTERIPALLDRVSLDSARGYGGKYIDVERAAVVLLEPK
jgi:predicted Zn-dependent peptidase